MWVNVFCNHTTKKYLLLTDEDIDAVLQIHDEPIYCDDILLEEGYEILSANLHTFDGAAKWMKKYYPEYSEVKYKAKPVTFKEVREFVNKYHRHHVAPQGYKFAVAVKDEDNTIGVAIAGRPVNRHRDDGTTIEITRLCVKPGFKNVCSILYAKVCRISRELGYERVITYTLESETGTSLMAAGFICKGTNKGGSWCTKSRPRADKAPILPKKIWELELVY